MIGTKIYKSVVDWDYYAKVADWCNDNKAMIVEREDCYEVVPIPAPTFEELKATKLAELSAAFSARVSGSFRTSYGYSMQFDTMDSLKMQGALQLMEATGQDHGYLVQADDTVAEGVTLETMKNVLTEMMTAYSACHQRKQELRARINACGNADELNAVVISWPV